MKSKRATRCGVAIAIFAGVLASSAGIQAADTVERITATTVAGKTTPAEPVTIELLRWSTDAERAQLLPILSGKPVTPKDAEALGKSSLGYVWGNGSIGYPVRYAEKQGDRIVLVVERDLSSWQGKPNWIVPTAPKIATEPEAPRIPGAERPYPKLLIEIGNEAYEGIKYEHAQGVSNDVLAKSYNVTVEQVERVVKLEDEATVAAKAAADKRALEQAPKPADLKPYSVVELRLAAVPQGKVASATKIAADTSKGLMMGEAPAAEAVQLKGIKRGNGPAAAATRTPAAAPKAAAPATSAAAPKAPAAAPKAAAPKAPAKK